MSEAETTEVEVPEVEKTQMEINLDNFVDAIQATNYNQAGDLFNDMLGSKLQDAMEAEKVSVAADIFNNNDEDIDIEDLELDLEDDVEEYEEVEVEEEPEEDIS
jgi:hypothetical protein